MKLARKLLLIDRRIIFLLVLAGAVIPILFPIGLAVQVSPPVRAVFQRVEALRPGQTLLLSFDYGPSDGPELDPMADAILRHCHKRGVKVVGLSLFPLGGVDMAFARLRQLATELGARDGEDWVNLGYKDGGQAAMKAMGDNLALVFPVDANGVPVGEIPLMRAVRNYNDVGLAVSLATSVLGEWWINLVNAQFGVDVAVGTTAVSAPKYYAFMEAKQAVGVIGGMKGASEYEELVAEAYPDLAGLSRTATVGMDVQSIVHLVILFFILFGNAMFLATRRTRQEA
ncbi:MAG: hypothetical protein FJY75_04340 [Candidatus Eisenbacteria bacterium]|uniref:Uncharacterized protein n=1 Tax=Eiseniibacteriota bacterium TaxID=2212470 RepID=A0A937X731_UNCEI|nr:hypothetical protein [Candidatus Eisenbacteria bacterium]